MATNTGKVIYARRKLVFDLTGNDVGIEEDNINDGSKYIAPFTDTDMCPLAAAPTVPQGLRVADITSTSFKILWDAVSQSDGYKVDLQGVSGSESDVGNSLNSVFNNLSAAGTYTVRVWGYNDIGDGNKATKSVTLDDLPSIDLTLMGAIDAPNACSDTNHGAPKYISKVGEVPNVGDYVYANADATGAFNGNNKWYKDFDYANGLQIDNVGKITHRTPC